MRNGIWLLRRNVGKFKLTYPLCAGNILKEAYLYSAYYELLISRRSGMARVKLLTRDHAVSPATHAFIHTWYEPCSLLTPQSHSVTALSRPAEGRRLSWRRVACPPEDG